MAEPCKAAFLVDPYSDPVLIRVEGRACFQNSAGLGSFFTEMIRQGKVRLAVDFQACTTMDSTFLGVLAGAAQQVRRCTPPGSLTLCRLGQRNLELVRNLGLHRLAVIDAEPSALSFEGSTQVLPHGQPASDVERARLVLRAHENLSVMDEANRAKFQDVVNYLKAKVGEA